MAGKRSTFDKFILLFQKGQYEDLFFLIDPKFQWELRGIPSWQGKYSLKRIKALYNKLNASLEAKMHIKLHQLIVADKYAVAYLTQSVKQYGQKYAMDAIWLMELNRRGNKILRIQSFLMASPEIQSYAEMMKAAA
jgi:hypothetical protein